MWPPRSAPCLWAFFGAVASAPPRAHSPENPCPAPMSRWGDRPSVPRRPLACHAFCRPRWGSERPLWSCGYGSGPRFCPCVCVFAAVQLLLLYGIGGTLAPAFRAGDDAIGSPLAGQRAGGDPAGITLRCHAERGEGTLQDREQAVNPIVGLGLAQLALQAVHGLEGIRFLEDENKQEFIFPMRPAA